MERKYTKRASTANSDKSYKSKKPMFGERKSAYSTPRSGGVGRTQKYAPKTSGYIPKSNVSTGYTPREGRKTFGSPVSNGYVRKAYTPRNTSVETRERKPYAPKKAAGASLAYSKHSSSKSKIGARKEAWTPKPKFKSVVPNKPRTASASWGGVAPWYDKHLTEADTYHEKVILPNLLRNIDAKKADSIIDLACGQGYFTKALHEQKANTTGVDIASELIAIAEQNSPDIKYIQGSADKLPMFEDGSFSKALISLAIQNIENTEGVMMEASRILSDNGEMHIVMNHPAFRIPKASSWEYDDKKKVQSRRVDEYLSNSRAEIDMHPGYTDSPQTISFHRPLQYYFKAFAKAGFAVVRLEEWISHRTSDSGPRAIAENKARKEIPLFLYLKLIKIK